MKKIAIIVALMLVLGVVFISGCTTTPTNTTGNNSGQNKSSGVPGYSTGQIISIGSENIVSDLNQENPMIHRDTNHLNLYSHFFLKTNKKRINFKNKYQKK